VLLSPGALQQKELRLKLGQGKEVAVEIRRQGIELEEALSLEKINKALETEKLVV